MPSCGKMNQEWIASWFQRETDDSMWALNLMKYCEVADYGEAGPELGEDPPRLGRG
jgi:hypothetical protein